MVSRILSIDYGSKRIGVAITDPLKIFAKPYTTIENRGDSFTIDQIAKIVHSESIEKIILGLPISTQDNDTEQTLAVRSYYQKLSQHINGTEIVLWDERFTTSEATDFLKEKGISWRDSKKIVDQIAAAMILKSYLSQSHTRRY